MAVGRNPITVYVVSRVKDVGGASSLRAGPNSRRSQWPIAAKRGAWRKSRIDQSGSFSSVSGSQPFLCSWQARKMNPFLITSSSVRLFIYHREVVVDSVRPVFDELVLFMKWPSEISPRKDYAYIVERECSLCSDPAPGLRTHDNQSKEGVLKDSWRLVGGFLMLTEVMTEVEKMDLRLPARGPATTKCKQEGICPSGILFC